MCHLLCLSLGLNLGLPRDGLFLHVGDVRKRMRRVKESGKELGTKD